MYLALLLSAESEAELRRHAADAPADLHLTVIHSKHDPGLAAGLFPVPSVILSIHSFGQKLDTFGPPTKRVKVLQVADTEQMWDLRRKTEALLRAAYIPWSTSYNWQPHLTLGKSGYGGALPVALTFDRLEWR